MLEFYHSMEYSNRIIFLIVSMLFLHVIADYLVQNEFMAKFKQKKNWEDYNDTGLYSFDYIAVLLAHTFSWSFIVFFPLLIEFKDAFGYFAIVLINTGIHAYIDDYKCNKLKISLITDQILHIAQIMMTIGIGLLIY